jgi:signal transduction histidine kinase
MLVDIFLVLLALVVALLIGVDMWRTPSDSPHGQADRQAADAERLMATVSLGTGAKPFIPEPAATEMTVPGPDADLPRRPEAAGSPADGRQRPAAWSAAQHKGSRRGLTSWSVRTRLFVLAGIGAVAAAVVTLSAVRMVDSLRSTSIHSPIGSVRDGAITSAIVASIVGIVVLALAAWCAIIVIRSVLRPLGRLRAGVLDAAGVRLPDAIHLIGQSNGEGGPPEVKPIDVESADEIADVARAFDQVNREVLRLAANEAALRGKLNAMFVNLSHRSESLAERQIRLIDDLEQRESDAERLTKLFKLDHLATRMRRYAQNLLVLAGQDMSGQWNRPMALVNVIRAAVSEIEEYERVALTAQPGIAVRAPAVNDLVHLLAELAENATSLSAANTPVTISGRRLATGGVLVDITDQGFGMSADEMAHANWRLENPLPEITAYRSMGLFVVGRLAARHGVRVRLLASESGGLTALVWLPDSLIMNQDPAAPDLSSYGNASSRPDSADGTGAGYHGRLDPDRAIAD